MKQNIGKNLSEIYISNVFLTKKKFYSTSMCFMDKIRT